MSWLRRAPKPPDGRGRGREGDERVVELARLPLWQAQLVLHHLWEAGVPVTLSEGSGMSVRIGDRQSLARLWVMERRLPEARAAMAEIIDPV